MTQTLMEEKQMVEMKVCPECGEEMLEQHDAYLLECDRCLSKKSE